MRALITGAGGFVGRYLAEELTARGAAVTATGDHAAPPAWCAAMPTLTWSQLDVRDADAVERATAAAAPDAIFHLAAQSFVPESLARPRETFEVNALGTLALCQGVARLRARGFEPLVLITSSAEVYGAVAAGEVPVDERRAANPANPYAASKAAQEAVALAAWHAWGVRCVIARAFNHIGPGQSPRFVVPSFARRLAEIAAGGDPVLMVGNLESRRDFTDVRDVVRAYALLAERGRPGEIYNVCSGHAYAIKDILRELILLARVGVEVREDPARLRPSDTPILLGSNAKLRAATGWEPAYRLERTLEDVYAYERSCVVSA
ncbi:MAG TPA: SDR family NAD(P)-dependent oxidoreductase [Candidatus Dormibacteraeota bacterium]|nr:SDR family NAD(P)-dependent oxidoreductase [Candidatus Dormibacteraeota bacterium]